MIDLLRPTIDTMGKLLGPASVAEIVITLYEDERINYQFEGMKGPVPPALAYKLLATVAKELEPHLVEVTKQEVPNE